MSDVSITFGADFIIWSCVATIQEEKLFRVGSLLLANLSLLVFIASIHH